MIFIDSSYLIALSIKTDKNNKRAKELKLYLNEKRVINEIVLTETLNTFSKRCNANTKDIYKVLDKTNDIVFLEKEDYLDAMDICNYYNNAINFSDCIILNTMQKLQINKIASFDKDFDKINTITRIH